MVINKSSITVADISHLVMKWCCFSDH